MRSTRLTELIEKALRQRAGAGGIVILPTGDAETPRLSPQVGQGRWFVRCPWCPGATILVEEDPRFFCCDCCNAAVGGRYLPVDLPPDIREIERVLMRRPDVMTRNWLPGETVADLDRENIEHGVFAWPG